MAENVEWKDNNCDGGMEPEAPENTVISDIQRQITETMKLMDSCDRTTKDGCDMYMMYSRQLNQLNEISRTAKAEQNEILQSYRIKAETERAQNEAQAAKVEAERGSKFMWAPIVIPVLGQIAGSVIGNVFNRKNVKTVVKTEDEGGIVNSKATMFLNKPRN